jgi:uncharacterized protein (DUF4415 family)
MNLIELNVDEAVLRQARQYADEHQTTLERLLAEYVAVLAGRAGRRLTVREQTYVDYRTPEEVVEALQAEGPGSERKGALA